MTPPPIRLDRVTLRRGGRDAVRDLSGVFAPGTLTAVTGPNGAGKSTLLRALCGLQPVASGRIDRGGLRLRDMALLPQEGSLDRRFPIACRDAVALGWTARLGLFRRIGAEHLAAADEALDAVGLGGLGGRAIGALSAGQFQRVLFARTIVRDAPVILLDEPFSAVDAATEDDLLALLRAWHRRGRTVVVVLHDHDLIRESFPRTLLLGGDAADGTKPAWGDTAEVLPLRAARGAGRTRDPALPDAKDFDPAPPDPARANPAHANPAPPDPARSDLARPDPARPALVRPNSAHSDPARPDPARPDPPGMEAAA